jgi:hypothetical protein
MIDIRGEGGWVRACSDSSERSNEANKPSPAAATSDAISISATEHC